ncbi:hypothetical protein [Geminisphaera colitermitum]|uniref:hypothetical protein n=1 Tax=Geminisphaera colitermitum TaxID=1148786 RepID=UPI000158C81F|nr:hypothetical protein [Geminisphaera colitermitum]
MRRIAFFIIALVPVLACAAPTPLPDAVLKGHATVPSGSTLTIASGGALTVASGTTITGVATSASLDGKVDKVTSASIVYGTDSSGNQIARNITATIDSLNIGNLITVGSGGHIWSSNEPTSGAHLTRKSYVDARTPQPAYLVFVIPIGPGFYDFELKATLSNFGEHAPFTDLVFYYHSPDPARTSVTSQVGAVPSVWFTDTGNSDKRRWRKQPANQSIWQTRIGVVPAVIVYVPIDATIRPGNAPLIWSYQRITATDYEQVWYPIFPATSPVLATP